MNAVNIIMKSLRLKVIIKNLFGGMCLTVIVIIKLIIIYVIKHVAVCSFVTFLF